MLDLQTVNPGVISRFSFLIGQQTHSRAAGLFAASLAVIQGINGIRLMDSTKVMLSEPFMQLSTALITLIALLALKQLAKERFRRFLFLEGYWIIGAHPFEYDRISPFHPLDRYDIFMLGKEKLFTLPPGSLLLVFSWLLLPG